jgi:hypothetical protein
MSYQYTEEDINKISVVLGSAATAFGQSWTWNLKNAETRQAVSLTIYGSVEFSDSETGSLVSVQTLHGYFELHNCTSFMTFEPDEVIFVLESSDKVSCLIISKLGACSMFSNIRREILNADFTTLDSPLLLSAMQLSITESLLEQ